MQKPESKTNQEKQDYSISMLAANVYSLLIAIPLFIVIPGLHIAFWGTEQFVDGLVTLARSWLYILILIVGIVIHELLHAIGWQALGQLPWGTVKFGIDAKTLSPYAHCTELLDTHAYRIGALLPGLVLGFVLAALGIITGAGTLTTFGTLFAIAASGDLLSLWLLRNVPPDSLVEDHPSRVGCYVLEKER